MRKEGSPPRQEPFGLIEQERLFDRINYQRFMALLIHEQIVIHEVDLNMNSFGEFFFVRVNHLQNGGQHHSHPLVSGWGNGQSGG